MSKIINEIQGQRSTNKMKDHHTVSVAMLEFVKHNVLNITDLTRTNKLTEILDSFSNKKSEDIFIVQNSRNKEAQGALVDISLLQELLMYREAVEDAMDTVVYQMALERKDSSATIGLAEVIQKFDLDVNEILKLSEELEIE